MDMTTTTTTTLTTPTTTTTTPAGGLTTVLPPTKSPEAESETPPRIQPTKPIYFTNGVLKLHSTPHHAPPAAVIYKECLKNHAASLGGHALDGCGEFMPAPTATASDPTSLKCAACGCHRNFHRRDPDGTTIATAATVIEYHPHHRHHPLPPPLPAVHGTRSPGSQSPPPISSSYYPGSAPHMLLALSGGAADNNNHHHHHHNHNHHQHLMNSPTSGGGGHPTSSRKRFRTKFSQDQKDKMYEFAEKVGWKMQKSNEEMVNGFCSEIGVERGVFKVWMHNNKNTFGKRSANSAPNSQPRSNHRTTDNSNGNRNDNTNGNGNRNDNTNGNGNSHSSSVDHHHHHNHHGQFGSNESNAPTNGSSSSS